MVVIGKLTSLVAKTSSEQKQLELAGQQVSGPALRKCSLTTAPKMKPSSSGSPPQASRSCHASTRRSRNDSSTHFLKGGGLGPHLRRGQPMDLLALAICLPFFIAALMAHFGHNFSQENYDTGEKK